MKNSKLFIWAVSLFLFLSFRTGASARTSPVYPSELELVRKALLDSLSVCLQNIPLSPQTGVRLTALTKNKANWLVENCLGKALLEKGCYPLRNVKETGSNTRGASEYTLSYRIVDLKLEYGEPKGSVFKQRLSRRRMRLDCFLSLSEAERSAIVWSKWLQIQSQDLVPAGKIESLKSKDFLQRSVLQHKNRWVEILLVMGAIGSMVYTLF